MITLTPTSSGATFPAPPPRVKQVQTLPSATPAPAPAPQPPTQPKPAPAVINNVSVVTIERQARSTIDQLGKAEIEKLTGFAPDVPELLCLADYGQFSGSIAGGSIASCFNLRVQTDALRLSHIERELAAAAEVETSVRDLINSRDIDGSSDAIKAVQQFLISISANFESLRRALDPRSSENRLTSAYLDASADLFTSSSAMPQQTPAKALQSSGHVSEDVFIEHCTATKAFMLLCEAARRAALPTALLEKISLVAENEAAASFSATSETSSALTIFNDLSLSDAINTPADKITQLLSKTLSGVRLLDSIVKKSNSLSTLLVTLSREYRLSAAASVNSFDRVLSSLERQRPTQNFQAISEALYGSLGRSVLSTQVTGSCMSTAASVIGDKRVLVYEDAYIGDSIPGQRAYFETLLGTSDNVFSLNAMTDLYMMTNKTARVLAHWIDVVREPPRTDSASLYEHLKHADDLSQIVLSKLTSAQSTSPDPFAMILRLASTDFELSSALFCYVISRMSLYYDDGTTFVSARDPAQITPLSLAALDALTKRIFQGTGALPPAFDYSFTRNDLAAALQSRTGLFWSISQFFADVLNAFRYVQRDSKTLYSSVSDLCVLLFFYSIVVIASNQTVTSVIVSSTLTDVYAMTMIPTRSALTSAQVLSAENSLLELNVSLHSFLSLVSSAAKSIIDLLSSQASQQNLQLVKRAAGDSARYIMTPEQIAIIDSVLTDAISSTKASDKYVTDGQFLTQNTAQIVSDVCQNASGSVIAVGLPYGFMSSFGKRVADDQVFVSQPNSDIINVIISKRDMLRSRVIFQPVSYTFDLLRFTVRDQAKHAMFTPVNSWSLIPTRRHASDASSGIEFAAEAAQLGTLAMSGDDYSWLTLRQKRDIAKNHAVSYCLETMLRVTFGLDLDETRWLLLPQATQFDTELVNVLFETRVLRGATVQAPPARSSSSVAPLVVGASQAAIQKAPPFPGTSVVLTEKQSNVAAASNSIIASAGIITSKLTDPLTIAQRVVAARKFDRVFILPIDKRSMKVDTQASQLAGASLEEIENASDGTSDELTSFLVSIETLK